MRYLDEMKKYKHFKFYRDLLEYMFEKFELASEEDEDVCFEILKWDLNKMDSDLDIGVINGYSIELQLEISKYKFSKEMEINEEKYEKSKEFLDRLLEEYSKNS